ncbi:ABC-2 type transporter [Verrucomicrobium sp. GAS474]|nr:ABC-2 type transporter [Verrucomicrobium sp. GAS474]
MAQPKSKPPKAPAKAKTKAPAKAPAIRRPDAVTQFVFVLLRRIVIFFKVPSQCWLQLALILAFPLLVVLFVWNGLPQTQNMSMTSGNDMLTQLKEAAGYTEEAARIGGLVSGLVMIQVVLLGLMGSNNGAREVAGERLLFEKEKLAGLRPGSYLLAKSTFVFTLAFVQSVWMTIFVYFVGQFPGDLLSQFVSLFLTNAAISSVCLAISCWAPTAEQASMISIYLVGFQLPLSGAVLALPEPLGSMVRPFIASYWGWSSYLQTIQDTRFYDMVKAVAQTPLSSSSLCWWMLLGHIAVGQIFAWLGCVRSRWSDG